MSIYVGTGRINYPAMRGPCPYGYHVAQSQDRQNLYDAYIGLGLSNTGANFSKYLKMPLAGWRHGTTSNAEYQGTYGWYWSCNYRSAMSSYALYLSIQSNVTPQAGGNGSHSNAYSIRPYKDEPVKPTSSWTTLYDGSSVASGAGIFWSSSSGLISISSDGNTWYTIADKNLGATTVYNDGDTLSEANCGKYFQRGNNYPFPRTGSVTTSTTLVDASSYGPGNWYYNNTFRKPSSSPYDRSSVTNNNLRGGVVGAVKADVKHICVGAGVDDYSPMQGPCPDGFHVPGGTNELNERGLINVVGGNLGVWSSTNGTDFSKYLKLPLAGYLSGSSGSRYSSESEGWYACNQVHPARRITSNSVGYTRHSNYDGFSVRPFKDEPVVPDSTWTTLHQGTGSAGIFWNKGLGLISLSSNGTKWYTIADRNLGAKKVWNYGDTLNADNCGFFYQSGNNYGFPYSGPSSTSTSQVDVSNYGPSYPYYSSTFIKRSSSPYEWGVSSIYKPGKSISTFHDLRGSQTLFQKKGNVKHVYVGTTPARPTYNPGIYWNKSKGLISISSDGKNWVTIADKNLGATKVWNYGDALSQDNCGYYYQWGNNYGFAYTGTLTTTTTKVNTTNYGPTNPYYGSAFVKVSSSPYDWSTSINANLWGDTTNTLVARQGPCPEGWHIPTVTEWNNVVYPITNNPYGLTQPIDYQKYLKMPLSGYRGNSNSNVNNQGVGFKLWTSTSYQGDGNTARNLTVAVSGQNPAISTSRDYKSQGNSIRAFKNEPVVPDNSRYVLYQPS